MVEWVGRWMDGYVKLLRFQVVDQKRVRVFPPGFQTPRNG